VSASWSIAPVVGKLSPRTGPKTTLTTLRVTGAASVTATVGTLSETAPVRITPGRLRIPSITYRGRSGFAVIAVRAADSAQRPISRTAVSIAFRLGGRKVFTGRATTGAAGKATFRVRVRATGCYVTTVRAVSSPGFTWDRHTPRNRYCRR
jgi:hypothetical protein